MSQYNPYTPPQQDAEAPRFVAGGAASWDGKALLVPKQFSFPRVCLKCASPEVHSRRTQGFAFTPTWARMMILVCTPGAIVAMALTTKRATLELPLCDPCQARWKSARTWSIVLSLGMLVALFGLIFGGLGGHSDELGLIVGVAVLVIIVAFAIGMRKLVRPHMLQAKKIDDVAITLLGVNPTAGEQVARSA